MKVLVDSDFLFALFVGHDPHHKIATQQFRKFRKEGAQLSVLNIVIQEAATVISHKVDQHTSVDFFNKIQKIKELQRLVVDEKLEERAWEVFLKQTKKGTSFVDCANLAAARSYGIDKIATFDRFYPKELLLGGVVQ